LVAREEAYRKAREQLAALLPDCPDFVAAMATVAAVLKDHLDHVSWVGFYVPEEGGSLRVGPYQGPVAGTRLPAGQGVCGAVARSRASLVVPDVAAFEGHIACDPRSRSEIVGRRGDAGVARTCPHVLGRTLSPEEYTKKTGAGHCARPRRINHDASGWVGIGYGTEEGTRRRDGPANVPLSS